MQHAHQKAIIHRDLKPSNILVSEVDGKPMPRIIDFGVAKATSQRLTAGTMYTRVGAIVGTPGYMSPEQADSAGEDIDTRTDVYSLGVVLYELLVGALPLDLDKLAWRIVAPAARTGCAAAEHEGAHPRRRLGCRGAKSSAPTYRRCAGNCAATWTSIALKALEKDRTRRYGSPSDLAADIGRYLRNEPVLAVPAFASAYRARKFSRRYRVGPGHRCCLRSGVHRGGGGQHPAEHPRQ